MFPSLILAPKGSPPWEVPWRVRFSSDGRPNCELKTKSRANRLLCGGRSENATTSFVSALCWSSLRILLVHRQGIVLGNGMLGFIVSPHMETELNFLSHPGCSHGVFGRPEECLF